MNRSLQFINLAGVVALGVLCALQWRTNRTVNLEVNRLEKVHQEQTAKLTEQDKALKGSASDLESFRHQLTTANVGWKESEVRLKNMEREIAQLTNERDQLKSSVPNWANAVMARDERLKEAAEQLQKLLSERDAALEKFNELAGKYNTMVNDLNVRTTNYNTLVERFNALNKSAKTNAAP